MFRQGSWDTGTLLKEHILLPRPRVIVHIQKQSYDINDVDVEEGHHHHEVSPGADAALLDVHALPGQRVMSRCWRGEMIHQLPLQPVQTLLILTHLLLNHCSRPVHCPGLTSPPPLYLLCYLASVITHYYMPTWRFRCRYCPYIHKKGPSCGCVWIRDLCRNFFRMNRR